MSTFKDLFGFDIFDSESWRLVRLGLDPATRRPLSGHSGGEFTHSIIHSLLHAQGFGESRQTAKPVIERHEYRQSGDPYRGTILCVLAAVPTGQDTVEITRGKWLRRDWIMSVWGDGLVIRHDGVKEQGDVEYLQRAGLL